MSAPSPGHGKAGYATVVALSRRTWPAESRWSAGQRVEFGRSDDCNLIVDIPQVSRAHGFLFVGPHFVTVTRYSGTHEVWVDQFDANGPELLDEGRTAVIDGRAARVHVRAGLPPERADSVADLFGTPVLEVRVPAPLSTSVPAADLRGVSTTHEVSHFRAHADHLFLIALCEHLVAPAEGSRVHVRPLDLPTNSEIAHKVGAARGRTYKATTVREKLSGWRARLGLPPTRGRHCSCSLAVAAVQSGLVTADDVDLLSPQPNPTLS